MREPSVAAPNPGSDWQNRDVIVIGASAGGLQVLQRVLTELPVDLPASIFIVLHMGASSHLAEILDRTSTLPVVQAASGATVEAGRVTVAVPGVHLLLHDNHLLLRRGPRENMARPAVDPLFRSAACSFGGRVIGVVLSGALNDGTAGLSAIKRCGGLAVVQDPADAAMPDMPRSALRYVDVDYMVSADKLAPLLVRLAGQQADETPDIPLELRLEAAIAAQELAGMAAEDQLGVPSRFTCPECHGTLWELNDGSMLRYRCHVGHAYTGQVMLSSQAVRAEEMLWNLMRVHHERAELARRMAEQEEAAGHVELASQLRDRARGYDEDASVVRTMLQEHRLMPLGDDQAQEVH